MSGEDGFDSRERLLSPEELANCVTRQKDFSLPTIGTKLTEPTGSFLESKHIQSRLRSLHDVTAFPRVNQRNQISEASWDSSMHLAKVSKAIGHHWETLGHLVDSQLCLHPEEALFLMESNNLVVTYGGVAMSMQQAYELMLGAGHCMLEEHLTFSMLARLGYKVVRHQGDLGITSYERQIRLDRYQRKRKTNKSSNLDSGSSKQSKCEEIQVLDDDSSPEVIIEEPAAVLDNKECVDLTLDSDDNQTVEVEEQNDNIKSKVPEAEESRDEDDLRHGPLATLWKSGSTVPKLCPSESISTAGILAKLSIKTREDFFIPASEESTFKISFDVYLPSVRLRKSIPKLPNYRLVVCRPDSKVPTSQDVKSILGPIKDGVPLLFAICSLTNISFFCFSQVDLPVDISIG